jgi:predicted HTH domain antitoxin
MVLTISYPDSLPDALRTRRVDFEREARLLLALRLFELGRVTSGQAAEMAGLGRVEFLMSAGHQRIEAMMPDADELAGDVGVR